MQDEIAANSEDVKGEDGAEKWEETCVQRLPSADGAAAVSSLWRVAKNGVVHTIIVPAKPLTCNQQSLQTRTYPTMRRLAPKPPVTCTVGPVAVQTDPAQMQQPTFTGLHFSSDHRAAAAATEVTASSSLVSQSLASRRRCPCKSKEQTNRKSGSVCRKIARTEPRLPEQLINTPRRSVSAVAAGTRQLIDCKDKSAGFGDGPTNMGQSSIQTSRSRWHLSDQPCDNFLVEASTTSFRRSVASRQSDVTADAAAALNDRELGQPTPKVISVAASVIIPSAGGSLDRNQTVASCVVGLRGLRNVRKKLAKNCHHRIPSIAPRPAPNLIPRCPTEIGEMNPNVATKLSDQPQVVEVPAYQNAHMRSPLPSTGLLPATAPCINVNCNNMIIIASPTHVGGGPYDTNFSVFQQFGGTSLSEVSPVSSGKVQQFAGFQTTGYAIQSGDIVTPSAISVVPQRAADSSQRFVKVAADITDSCLPTSVGTPTNLLVVQNAGQAANHGSIKGSLFICSPTQQSSSLGPVLLSSPTNGIAAATTTSSVDTNRVLGNVVDLGQQTVVLRPVEGAGTETTGTRPATQCGNPATNSAIRKSSNLCNAGSTHSAVRVQPLASRAVAPSSSGITSLYAEGTKRTGSVAVSRSRRRQRLRNPLFISKARATGVAETNSVAGRSNKVTAGKHLVSQRGRARKLKMPLRTTQKLRPILPRPSPHSSQFAAPSSTDASLVSEHNLGGSVTVAAAVNLSPSLIHCVAEACLISTAKPCKVQTRKNPATRTFEAPKRMRPSVGSSSRYRKKRVLKPSSQLRGKTNAADVDNLSEQHLNRRISLKQTSVQTQLYENTGKQLTSDVKVGDLCSESKAGLTLVLIFLIF
jgi:hypothetical protein